MEIVTEMKDGLAAVISAESEAGSTGLAATLERLAAAAEMLEQAAGRLFEQQGVLAEEGVGRVVATVESTLDERLVAAEAEIASLREGAGISAPALVTYGRKTLPVAMVNLLAKQGVTVDSMEAGALDAALAPLSVEQRIAVKAQLMRAGLVG